jgi:type VI secretion system secreted protein Hcp
MSRLASFSMAGLVLFALALPASAEHIYCTVVGVKQGAFGGTTGLNGNTKQFPVLALTEEVTTSYDPSTGLGSGKRQHSPVTIIKLLDRSSTQFFTAAVDNETLTSVTCTLYRESNGGERPYFKILLTHANIVDIKEWGDGASGDARGDERERISFVYQKIELTDLDTGATAADDWLAGP